eukprot:scaffold107847_cov32-Tisochrysis_lutea.AAC.3
MKKWHERSNVDEAREQCIQAECCTQACKGSTLCLQIRLRGVEMREAPQRRADKGDKYQEPETFAAWRRVDTHAPTCAEMGPASRAIRQWAMQARNGRTTWSVSACAISPA